MTGGHDSCTISDTYQVVCLFNSSVLDGKLRASSSKIEHIRRGGALLIYQLESILAGNS
jgi:hypothetical protein